MIDRSCKSCKYWSEPMEYYKGLGDCARIPHFSSYGSIYNSEETKLTPKYSLPMEAAVEDASGWHACFMCKETFGCSLWEGK